MFVDRTATMGLKGFALRLTITVSAVMGFSLFGYNQGMMSGILQGDQFISEFPPMAEDPNQSASSKHNKHVAVLQGGVTSSYEIGCFFGAVFVLFCGEKLGRKAVVLSGCSILLVGVILSASSFGHHWGLGQFVIGRVVTGIGNGFNTATIPVWQSEMSKPEHRGRLVNLEGSVVAMGTMIAYWLDFGLSFVKSSVQWRLPVAVQAVFALFVLFTVMFLPESPRWLIAHGFHDEGEHVEASLIGRGYDDPEVVASVSAMHDEVARIGDAMDFKDLLKNGRTAHFNRMLIGSSTQFFQQFTGCNAAIYYSTVLFSLMNVGRTLSLIMGGVFATVYFLATWPSFYLIEHLGRRRLFMLGAFGQGCSFLITFACLIDARADTKPELFKGAAVGLYLFITFFGMSILGLPWVYPPEINPLKTRTAAAACSTCTNWICNFAVVMFTPIFVNVNGEQGRFGAYLFFCLINFLWLPIIYFFYPETAGRSLEEIDIIFAKAYVEKKWPFQVAKALPKLSREEVNSEAVRYGIADEESNAATATPSGNEKTAAPGEKLGQSVSPSASDNTSAISSASK